MSSRMATLGVVIVILLAGCSGLGDGGTQQASPSQTKTLTPTVSPVSTPMDLATPTPTLTPTPATTSTSTASPPPTSTPTVTATNTPLPAKSRPSWVTADPITRSKTLFKTHPRGLRQATSFTRRMAITVTVGNKTPIRERQVIKYNIETKTIYSNGTGVESFGSIDLTTQYIHKTDSYMRTRNQSGEFVYQHTNIDEINYSSASLIGEVLKGRGIPLGYNTTFERTITRNNHVFYQFRVTGVGWTGGLPGTFRESPPETIANSSVIISQAGVIRRFYLQYTITEEGKTARFTIAFRYQNLGNTTITRPPWISKAT